MDLNFDKYLFRCSSLGRIMTGAPKSLTPPQEIKFLEYSERFKGEGKPLTPPQRKQFFEWGARKSGGGDLSAGVKSYLIEIHKEALFNRKFDIKSKYLYKGIEVEEASISLYSEIKGRLFIKNKKRFYNDYLSGEPDNLYYKVRDIKSSWDISTFPLYDKGIPSKMYYWQLLGYMALTGYKKAELIYCLVDTPEHLINDELRRTSWALGYTDLPETLERDIRLSLTFKDIPNTLKIKSFKFNYNKKDIVRLYQRISLCRNYLNSLNVDISNHLIKPL